MKRSLYEWQAKCLAKAIDYYRNSGDRHFVINAAPGSGKTLAALVVAERLVALGLIDRIVIIAPRKKIVKQWKGDHEDVFGRRNRSIITMTSDPGDDFDPMMIRSDIAATWSAIQNLSDCLQAFCQGQRVLVIADEVHHAALEAVWGIGTSNTFTSARYVMALTGTPKRSDGSHAIWLGSGISQTDAGAYEVTYREAIDNGWCQVASFHRHKGTFAINIAGNLIQSTPTAVLAPNGVTLDPDMAKACKYGKMVRQPIIDFNQTPIIRHGNGKLSYHASMIDWAAKKLDGIRRSPTAETRVADAGCLIIANKIATAVYFKKLIELMYPGDQVIIVHSKMPNAEDLIDTFYSNDVRWLVSVNMVSEGVDIPRLRVMVYLPNADTELYFRQAVGRVIRRSRPGDMSRAYVIIPELQHFTEWADNIEQEMLETADDPDQPRLPRRPPASWTCDNCGAENPPRTRVCHACGEERDRVLPPPPPTYEIDYEDTIGFREGAIVRGFRVDEDDVQSGEASADSLYARLKNHALLRPLIRQYPPEILGVVIHTIRNAIDEADLKEDAD